jgi:hypothetical protein
MKILLKDLHFPRKALHLVLEILGLLEVDGIVIEPAAGFVGEVGPIDDGHAHFLFEGCAVGQFKIFPEADPDFGAGLITPLVAKFLQDWLFRFDLLHAHCPRLGRFQSCEVILPRGISCLRCQIFLWRMAAQMQ